MRKLHLLTMALTAFLSTWLCASCQQVDQPLFAMVSLMGVELGPHPETVLHHIGKKAIFFDEHICRASDSITRPFHENSTRQWLRKGAYTWESLKKVTFLNEEVPSRFRPIVKKASSPVIYVFNAMGWERSGDIEIFIDNEIIAIENKFKITDISKGKEVAARVISKSYLAFLAEIPGDYKGADSIAISGLSVTVKKSDHSRDTVYHLKNNLI